MTLQDAIISIIGKEKYNSQIEAGISDLSILEFACLTSFLYDNKTTSAVILRTSLSIVWDKPPASLALKIAI